MVTQDIVPSAVKIAEELVVLVWNWRGYRAVKVVGNKRRGWKAPALVESVGEEVAREQAVMS